MIDSSQIIRATFAQKGSRLFRLAPSAIVHLHFSGGSLLFQLTFHHLLSILERFIIAMGRKPSSRIPLQEFFRKADTRTATAVPFEEWLSFLFYSAYTPSFGRFYDTCKLSTHTIGELPHEALSLPASFIFLVEEDLIEPEVQVFNKNGHILLDSFLAEVIKKAGIGYRVPYSTRHSFAAWALTLGMNPNKLVKRMGHGSKKMVYEVYGNYVEGLEKDADKILEYFGNDFTRL